MKRSFYYWGERNWLGSASGIPPKPLPFCPPERKSFNQNSKSGFSSKKVRTSIKKHRQNSESEETDKAGSRRRRDPISASDSDFQFWRY
ncbi:hypothetical protein COS33_00810, partial [Candidatus Wolfebacteria bacterium CG02_land_8_20_14_3_00_37_12]